MRTTLKPYDPASGGQPLMLGRQRIGTIAALPGIFGGYRATREDGSTRDFLRRADARFWIECALPPSAAASD